MSRSNSLSTSNPNSTAEPDLELDVDAGLVLLRVPSARSAVIHRLACARLAAGETGVGYWIDARNAASSHALYECASSPRTLENLAVARAFTAYQHHSLVRRVVRLADDRTELLVAPNVADLYGDEDLAAWEREDLLAATLTTLAELGRALACPVVVSAAHEEDAATIETYADYDVECRETREGIRLEGDGVETMGYWHADGRYWQTTIPYWVDLCGVASSSDVDPAVLAFDRGFEPELVSDRAGVGV